MKKWLGCLMVLVWLVPASTWAATVTVSFQPLTSTVNLGDNFFVDIVADISDPITGWGLDLSFDSTILSLSGAPVIDPQWTAVFASDGDGLAALAFNTPISGNGVALARLTFDAINYGTSDLIASVTVGDLTEGFPLVAPGTFADPTFINGSVTVIPLPAAVLFMATGLIGLIGVGRRNRNS